MRYPQENRIAAAMSMLIAWIAIGGSGASAKDHTIDDISRAWKARAERIRTGRIEWKETVWFAKGQSSWLAFQRPDLQGRPFPPEDTLIEYQRLLSFEGSHAYRYDSDGMHWEVGTLVKNRMLSVYSGSEQRTTHTLRPYPYAHVYSGAEYLMDDHLWPLRSWRAGLSTWFPFDLSSLHLTGRRESIDGHECIALDTSFRTDNPQSSVAGVTLGTTYWISPGQDFSIVGYTRRRQDFDRPTLEYRTTYVRDAHGEWLPSAWRMVRGGGERPDEVVEAVVTRCEINIPIDSSEFELEFVPGTMVQDFRTDDIYIVREGGRKRQLSRAERLQNLPYEYFLATDSPEDGSVGDWSIHQIVWITAFGVSVSATIAMLLRRRRHDSIRFARLLAPTVFCASFVSSGTATGAKDYTIDDISRAWKARAERIRTGRIEWKETRWLAKGGSPAWGAGFANSQDRNYPPEDTTIEYQRLLLFEGQRKLRYDWDGIDWCHDEFVKNRSASVYTGSEQRTTFTRHPYPYGQVNAQADNLSYVHMWPLRAWRAGVPMWFDIDLRTLEFESQREFVDGHECIVMTSSHTANNPMATNSGRTTVVKYSINPAQDFSIVGYSRGQLGGVSPDIQYRITYERHEQEEWCPARWQMIRGSGERPNEVVGAIVTRCEINPTIDASEFELAFVPGTMVEDYRTDEIYIAREGGRKRQLSRAERSQNLPYEYFLATESPETGSTGNWSVRTIVWIAAMGISIAAALTILLYRWRQNSRMIRAKS
jgi:hypothetical protein